MGLYFFRLIMSEKEKRFVVCVDNLDYPASLERYKIYQVVPDAEARADGEIRIVDESGEDYLYSKERFVSIRPPAVVRESLVCA
jgi:hypothetical protein